MPEKDSLWARSIDWLKKHPETLREMKIEDLRTYFQNIISIGSSSIQEAQMIYDQLRDLGVPENILSEDYEDAYAFFDALRTATKAS